jgi:hypothetical protein
LAPSNNAYRNIFGKKSAISMTSIKSDTETTENSYDESPDKNKTVTNSTVEMGYVLLLNQNENYTNI